MGRCRENQLCRHTAVALVALGRAGWSFGHHTAVRVTLVPTGASCFLLACWCGPSAQAKRVAERRGIPYVELERVSARRLMVALAPLMGVPVPPHLLEPSAPPQPRLRVPGPVATEAAALQQALPPGAAGRPRGGDGAAPAAARTVGELLGFGGAAQPARQGASGVDAGGRRAESRVQGSAAEAEGHPGLVAACVEEADVHDARRALLPPNPTERLGERHGIARPIKHGRRVRLKQELRKAAERDAAW